MKRIKQRLTVKTDYLRAVTVFMALLGAALVAVLLAGGSVSAEENENGFIYYSDNNKIYSIDPTASNPQPTFESIGATFDISPDRTTLVYGERFFGPGDVGPFYLFPLDGVPDDPWDPYDSHDVTELQITNLRDTSNCSFDFCGSIVMKNPTFSPDGRTIYFTGKQVLTSDTDDKYHLYSVPTEGGEASKIPINQDASNSLDFATFALSHDGSTFAFGGSDGVYTAPVRGGDATKVTDDGCKAISYATPSFSPDDQTIVYNAMSYSGDTCSGTGHRTIYTTPVNNDGTAAAGTPLPLSQENVTDKYSPVYSPDGKFITFENYDWANNKYNVAKAPATGGSITNIARSFDGDPLWIEKNSSPLPDTTPPSAPVISSPTNDSYYTDGALTISGTAEANSSVELFEGTTSKGTATANSSGEWSVPLTGVAEGTHTYTAKATDAAGNTSTYSDTVKVTVDTTVPKASTLVATHRTSKGVPLRKTNFKATFSEKMATIDKSNYKLFKCPTTTSTNCTTEITDATVTHSTDGLSATLNPYGGKSTVLAANTRYKVVVTTGAKDVAGNALDQDSFTAGNQQKESYFKTGSS